MTVTSHYLSDKEYRGLEHTGDVILPGYKDYPSFSESDAITHIDGLLSGMKASDRRDFKKLMRSFYYLPSVLIRMIVWLSQFDRLAPGPLGTLFRKINLGIKGVVVSLYYAGFDENHEILLRTGWDTSIETDPSDIPMDQKRSIEAKEKALENSSNLRSGRIHTAPVSSTAQNDVEKIVSRAREIESDIRALGVEGRCHRIEQLEEVIRERRDMIVDEIQAATGKSRGDALISEIMGVLDFLDYLSDNAMSILSDESVQTPVALMGKKSEIFYDPLGTVLVISPWNYPFYQAITPCLSAFIAGNAVIYKPSEHTPMEGLVEELLSEADFDSSWLQVVYGDADTGRELINAGPDKIFFTGSQSTGREILKQASEQLIPVELELGGKDPMIVFQDVDLDRAAAGATWGAFTNCGQSCTSVEKLFVHDDVYEPFKQKLLSQVNSVKQSHTADRDCDLGIMTTADQVRTVKSHLDDAMNKGAVELTDTDWDGHSRLIPPIVLENVSPDMLIHQEETFGPVLPLYSFSDREGVIQRANDTPYGLSASIWSADVESARKVARKLNVGNVSINNIMITEANPALPFGGTKRSGFGRYKGEYGLKSFVNVKSVMHESNSDGREANWYPYNERKYELFSEFIDGLFTSSPLGWITFIIEGLKLDWYSNSASRKDD